MTGLEQEIRTTPVVSVRGVRVRYATSNAWVGTGIDMDIRAGEVIILLGPSGCGKSSLLLTLPGLIPNSIEAELEGSINYNDDGVTVTNRVGMVFQDPDSQVVMGTLLDDVCFGLENLLVPVDEVEPRALAALAEVGLARDRTEALRSPSTLSGGERQRLAIACALALQPQILVLDEPTANLDPVASQRFYRSVRALASPSRAIVMVEHELDDVAWLATRVIVLDHAGKVALDGTPQQVIGGHAAMLRDLGVWLPTATELALRLSADAEGGTESRDTTDELLPLTAADLCQREDLALRLRTPVTRRRCELNHSAEVVVQMDGVRVDLGGRVVVHPTDLQVAGGEFLAVIGANGAGKSTLTRAIAGLVPLSGGRVTLCGSPLDEMDARLVGDHVGYVFQNPEHQFLSATVADELAYGLRVRRRSQDEIVERVRAMLDRFDLKRYRETNPFLLSHGEKRRLSVAAALITKPRLLILDEPTFGQDKARTQEIVDLVNELNRSGTAILMITHDLQLVADYAHRVAVLTRGHVSGVGPTAHVLEDEQLLHEAGLRIPPVPRLAQQLSTYFPAWATVYQTHQVMAQR